MSIFGSLMGDLEDDPFFGSHMRSMRQMNDMMNSMFASPFGMFGMGPPAIGSSSDRTRNDLMRNELMPFSFPNMNRMFDGFDRMGNQPNCHSFSSSTMMTMTSGPDGRPQEKLDNAKQTGSGGGEDMKRTDMDETVLDIIGKDSPVLEGLSVSESMEIEPSLSTMSYVEASTSREYEYNEEESFVFINNRNDGETSTPISNTTQSSSSTKWRNPKEKNNTDNNEKNKLQLELLKIQIYKSKLEARQIEMYMGLSKSKFTEDIPDPVNDIVIVDNINC